MGSAAAGGDGLREGPDLKGSLKFRDAAAASRDNRRDDAPCPARPGPDKKTNDNEVQRRKSANHDQGVIELGVDALVLPRAVRDDEAGSCIRLPVEHARTLLILLKQQLAELDKLQPRSRRSGRC